MRGSASSVPRRQWTQPRIFSFSPTRKTGTWVTKITVFAKGQTSSRKVLRSRSRSLPDQASHRSMTKSVSGRHSRSHRRRASSKAAPSSRPGKSGLPSFTNRAGMPLPALRKATGTRRSRHRSSITFEYISAWELPKTTTRGVIEFPEVFSPPVRHGSGGWLAGGMGMRQPQ